MNIRHFEKLIADPQARRELLWLRAKAKGHDDDARDIERVDPDVVERLRGAGFDVDADAGADVDGDVHGDVGLGGARGSRERYGRMMDERQQQHLDRLAREDSDQSPIP